MAYTYILQSTDIQERDQVLFLFIRFVFFTHWKHSVVTPSHLGQNLKLKVTSYSFYDSVAWQSLKDKQTFKDKPGQSTIMSQLFFFSICSSCAKIK